jgi:hypothetical protein
MLDHDVDQLLWQLVKGTVAHIIGQVVARGPFRFEATNSGEGIKTGQEVGRLCWSRRGVLLSFDVGPA